MRDSPRRRLVACVDRRSGRGDSQSRCREGAGSTLIRTPFTSIGEALADSAFSGFQTAVVSATWNRSRALPSQFLSLLSLAVAITAASDRSGFLLAAASPAVRSIVAADTARRQDRLQRRPNDARRQNRSASIGLRKVVRLTPGESIDIVETRAGLPPRFRIRSSASSIARAAPWRTSLWNSAERR